MSVNALSGLYLISTVKMIVDSEDTYLGVNALSGLYLISTLRIRVYTDMLNLWCQCPLGLIPHFYSSDSSVYRYAQLVVSMPSRAYTSFLPACPVEWTYLSILCQCPLGLIPHFYLTSRWITVIMKSMCQCPLGLIPHFYKKRVVILTREICMCQCPLGLIPHFYGTPSKT